MGINSSLLHLTIWSEFLPSWKSSITSDLKPRIQNVLQSIIKSELTVLILGVRTSFKFQPETNGVIPGARIDSDIGPIHSRHHRHTDYSVSVSSPLEYLQLNVAKSVPNLTSSVSFYNREQKMPVSSRKSAWCQIPPLLIAMHHQVPTVTFQPNTTITDGNLPPRSISHLPICLICENSSSTWLNGLCILTWLTEAPVEFVYVFQVAPSALYWTEKLVTHLSTESWPWIWTTWT